MNKTLLTFAFVVGAASAFGETVTLTPNADDTFTQTVVYTEKEWVSTNQWDRKEGDLDLSKWDLNLASEYSWKLRFSATVGSDDANSFGSVLAATGTKPFSGPFDNGFQFYHVKSDDSLVVSFFGNNVATGLKIAPTETLDVTISYDAKATTDNVILTVNGTDYTYTITGAEKSVSNIIIAGEAYAPSKDFTWGDVVITRVIPEPATATLSLLALAGLAARRRRK